MFIVQHDKNEIQNGGNDYQKYRCLCGCWKIEEYELNLHYHEVIIAENSISVCYAFVG